MRAGIYEDEIFSEISKKVENCIFVNCKFEVTEYVSFLNCIFEYCSFSNPATFTGCALTIYEDEPLPDSCEFASTSTIIKKRESDDDVLTDKEALAIITGGLL